NTAHGTFSLFSNTEGTANTANGDQALFSNLTGRDNTADGVSALFNNITGTRNTAIGALTLFNNTAGNENTAIGVEALFANTTGNFNTAIGLDTLFRNTEGTANTANGYQALFSNTEGASNTACGAQALLSNTTGVANTVIGATALSSNTTGGYNTASGVGALSGNTIGSDNTATGALALSNNISEGFNTATGSNALFNNTTGAANTANGYQALFTNGTGVGNTAIGDQALFNSTSNFNTALGTQAGTGVTTADGVICIGTNGQNVSNSCFIGNIRGATTAQPDAVPVVIDSLGQLGTQSSSRRFKSEIRPMGNASESILALNPVTFRYKNHAESIPQFGLIAEDVAMVNPALVVRDKNGEIYTVRYDAVNAMLLNEFLKEHCKVEAQQAMISELKSTVARQQKGMDVLTSQLKEQAARIETVSAQLEINLPAPKVVTNQSKY
ncbi:MAG TPA: tail fiber domain-containing protein, partial [Candidatus Udaeobacter sp.]